MTFSSINYFQYTLKDTVRQELGIGIGRDWCEIEKDQIETKRWQAEQNTVFCMRLE